MTVRSFFRRFAAKDGCHKVTKAQKKMRSIFLLRVFASSWLNSIFVKNCYPPFKILVISSLSKAG